MHLWNAATCVTIIRPLLAHNFFPAVGNVSVLHRAFASLSLDNSYEIKINASYRCNFINPCGNASYLSTSAVLMAMPVKRKRKIDPMIARNREEKRRKRLVKALKKMTKKARIPKPLLELEIDPVLLDPETLQKRERQSQMDLSPEEIEEKMEERALLSKEWNRFAGRRHVNEIRQIDTVLVSRHKALEEIRKESNQLYAEAIKPDLSIIDRNGQVLYQAFGPTTTPPIIASPSNDGPKEDHLVDGHYEDVTKKYAVQYADTKSFMSKLLHSRKREQRMEKAKKAQAEADD